MGFTEDDLRSCSYQRYVSYCFSASQLKSPPHLFAYFVMNLDPQTLFMLAQLELGSVNEGHRKKLAGLRECEESLQLFIFLCGGKPPGLQWVLEVSVACTSTELSVVVSCFQKVSS